MLAILESLKDGSTEIGPMYKKCVEMWSDILDDAENLTVDELGERLGHFQMKIEIACGIDRYLGKSIMAVSGFSYLYDGKKGFNDKREMAEKLYHAFDHSMVSIEVKSWVKIAGIIFHLVDI